MIDVIADRIVRKNPFLRDWSNYGIIDIFNPVETAQYQHYVTIARKPGMSHDFRDLRFFQPDGTEIPFWNESKTDGSTSFVWFKPYSLSQRKAYVFYGNREAVSQSNGDKTFEFFDDFPGSAVNAAKWTSTGASVSGGELTIAAANNNNVQSIPMFGIGYLCSCRAKSASWNAGLSQNIIGFRRTDAQGNGAVQTMTTYPTNTTFQLLTQSDAGGNTGTSYGSTPSANTYHIFDIIRASASNAILNVDRGTGVNSTSNIPTISVPITIRTEGASPLAIIADWILVRKYAATEPTCQLNQSGLRNPAYR